MHLESHTYSFNVIECKIPKCRNVRLSILILLVIPTHSNYHVLVIISNYDVLVIIYHFSLKPIRSSRCRTREEVLEPEKTSRTRALQDLRNVTICQDLQSKARQSAHRALATLK